MQESAPDGSVVGVGHVPTCIGCPPMISYSFALFAGVGKMLVVSVTCARATDGEPVTVQMALGNEAERSTPVMNGVHRKPDCEVALKVALVPLPFFEFASVPIVAVWLPCSVGHAP